MYINTSLNFTGSKFKLLEQILPEFDYEKKYFIDLFAGGGSVFTNIVDKYEKILVNDIISELIGIHKDMIESDVFIENVKKLCPNKDDKESFLKLRESFNNEKSSDKLFALMLSSTNNMMRFNKSYKYNQTFGERSFNKNTENKIQEWINHVRPYKDKLIFTSKHFSKIKPLIPSMVYIDPPYSNSEAGYNAYWNKNNDILLFEYCKNIHENGSSFVVSGVKKS